jgi:hypothetical protein
MATNCTPQNLDSHGMARTSPDQPAESRGNFGLMDLLPGPSRMIPGGLAEGRYQARAGAVVHLRRGQIRDGYSYRLDPGLSPQSV